MAAPSPSPSSGRRPALVIAGALAGLALLGALIESSAWFAPLRRVARDRSVAADVLDRGELGRILKGEDLIYQTAAVTDDRWRGQVPGTTLTARTGPPPAALAPPTTSASDASLLALGWTIIEVVVDPDDLYDPARGIVVNWEQDWERPARVAWYEAGELRFSSRCGLRLHGGTSRDPAIQESRDEDWRSFRVYLRERFGAPAFPEGLLPTPPDAPLDRLVLRGSLPLSSCLSYDIARRAGGQALHSRPVLFVLNAQLQGFYGAAEHGSRRHMAARLGHEQFDFYKLRSDNLPADSAAYNELKRWSMDLAERECTVAEVEERIDLDSFMRHMFVTAWCGNDDWVQGNCWRDRTLERPRWSWVHWDMDRSFKRHKVSDYVGLWEKDAHEVLLERAERGVRGRVFAGLLADDPEFLTRYAALAGELMNHRLDPAFLDQLHDHYATFRGRLGIPAKILEQRRTFLDRRSDFVFEEMSAVLGLPEAHRVQVSADPGVRLSVDGHPKAGPAYSGRYFEGQRLRVEAVGHSHFEVRGQRVGGESLDLAVDGPLQVRAVAP